MDKKDVDKKIKRIGIDARFYGPTGKGLGRYTKEIVDRVLAADDINEYVVFLYKENFSEFTAVGPRIRKVLVKARWYSFSEQIIMPWLIRREKLDLMHFPHFNVPLVCPAKFVVTIHDLILTRHPTQRATTLNPIFYKIKYFVYKVIIKSAIKRARKIIAVSQFTKNDIINQFKVNEKRITVTLEGIASEFKDDLKKNDKNVLLRYNIKEPYLLYVGNAYPHKNLEWLMGVFTAIRREKPALHLVLVGKDDYFYSRLKKIVEKTESGHILFPGYIPDSDLRAVYRLSLAYVFPSLYEGFGLPPLEAMANGCPVITSGRTSMPEILGEAAMYFDPENKEEMIRQVDRVMSDQDLRLTLINKGFEQAKKYSWDNCARQTLEIYNEVFS
ncbi:MAG: glycosyltransferase family 1 protein [Candidatus Falkowbacteria bacterium]